MIAENQKDISYSDYFSNGIPELMTEEDLIVFLRIPEVSGATDYHNVILNLIRFRDLPRIHISNKLLFPKKEILEWVAQETKNPA